MGKLNDYAYPSKLPGKFGIVTVAIPAIFITTPKLLAGAEIVFP
jgi:hypothetical protein